MGAFLGVERLGEAGEAEFRGDVGDAGLGAGLEAGLGVDEDEGAGAAGAHRGEQRLDAMERTVEVRAHEFVIGGERKLGPAAARRVGAGGVDERIDAAEAREDGGGHFLHGGVVADVAREGGEAASVGGGRECDRGREGVGAAADQRDAPAFGGEAQGDGATDAAAGTGDQGDGGRRGELGGFHRRRRRGAGAQRLHESEAGGGGAGEKQCGRAVEQYNQELFAGRPVVSHGFLSLWRRPPTLMKSPGSGTRLAPAGEFVSA